jgi:hypothetical protein
VSDHPRRFFCSFRDAYDAPTLLDQSLTVFRKMRILTFFAWD